MQKLNEAIQQSEEERLENCGTETEPAQTILSDADRAAERARIDKEVAFQAWQVQCLHAHPMAWPAPG